MRCAKSNVWETRAIQSGQEFETEPHDFNLKFHSREKSKKNFRSGSGQWFRGWFTGRLCLAFKQNSNTIRFLIWTQTHGFCLRVESSIAWNTLLVTFQLVRKFLIGWEVSDWNSLMTNHLRHYQLKFWRARFFLVDVVKLLKTIEEVSAATKKFMQRMKTRQTKCQQVALIQTFYRWISRGPFNPEKIIKSANCRVTVTASRNLWIPTDVIDFPLN